MGLITVEDLLEEVVGEILDEGDLSEEWIRRTGKNQILVDGRTEVRRINEFLKVGLDEEQNTISGLILEELGHIPAIGEKVQTDNCLLIVQDADERSIKGVQIIKEEPVPESSSNRTLYCCFRIVDESQSMTLFSGLVNSSPIFSPSQGLREGERSFSSRE